MKLRADKIASSTRNAKLNQELILSDEIICKEGYIVAVKVLNDKSTYNTVELVSGRMSRVCKGDIVAGVLGSRNALRGYSGKLPESLKVGDVINILNLGAVLGICTSYNPEIGLPFDVEVLGSVLHFPSFKYRIGSPAHIHNGLVQLRPSLENAAPLILVSGTCMSAGKTRAACEIVKQIAHTGRKVVAAKLTGISLMRDTLEMQDFGAETVLNFTDAGIVKTSSDNVIDVAKGIVHALSQMNPDCIVLELGDGIMGEYGVMDILLDKELMASVKAHTLAANDHVGAWGAVEYLRGKCPKIDVICGPVTDNDTGKNFVEGKLGVKAANAVKEGDRLGALIIEKVFGA